MSNTFSFSFSYMGESVVIEKPIPTDKPLTYVDLGESLAELLMKMEQLLKGYPHAN